MTLQAAGVPVKLYGGKETSHKKINADLGVAGDPGTQAVRDFVAAAVKP
jgi:hypothetical protein